MRNLVNRIGRAFFGISLMAAGTLIAVNAAGVFNYFTALAAGATGALYLVAAVVCRR